jgi:hypothetical protein
MKLLAVIFITLSLLAQTFSRMFIIADYYANTAAYAKNCINKSRPKMHCNGKCQMMKKILQEEKKDQENTERRENLKNEVLSSKSFFGSLNHPLTIVINNRLLAIFIYSKPAEPLFDIFHPPQLS